MPSIKAYSKSGSPPISLKIRSKRRGGSSNGFEWHYTPKHGSRLDIAECELSVLARQSLDRRIPDRARLDTETGAWTRNRNSANAKVNWRFATDDARIKLKHLYQQIS